MIGFVGGVKFSIAKKTLFVFCIEGVRGEASILIISLKISRL